MASQRAAHVLVLLVRAQNLVDGAEQRAEVVRRLTRLRLVWEGKLATCQVISSEWLPAQLSSATPARTCNGAARRRQRRCRRRLALSATAGNRDADTTSVSPSYEHIGGATGAGQRLTCSSCSLAAVACRNCSFFAPTSLVQKVESSGAGDKTEHERRHQTNATRRCGAGRTAVASRPAVRPHRLRLAAQSARSSRRECVRTATATARADSHTACVETREHANCAHGGGLTASRKRARAQA